MTHSSLILLWIYLFFWYVEVHIRSIYTVEFAFVLHASIDHRNEDLVSCIRRFSIERKPGLLHWYRHGKIWLIAHFRMWMRPRWLMNLKECWILEISCTHDLAKALWNRIFIGFHRCIFRKQLFFWRGRGHNDVSVKVILEFPISESAPPFLWFIRSLLCWYFFRIYNLHDTSHFLFIDF